MGVPHLREELSQVLIGKVSGQLPSIVDQLDARITSSRHNQDFLQRLSAEPDMGTVSRELEALVNQLHPASDSRRDLEEAIRSSIYSTVEGVLQEAAREAFPADAPTFDHTKPTKDVKNTAPAAGAALLLDELRYDPDKRPRTEQVEYRRNIARFRELLVYGGEGHMDGITQDALSDVRDRGVEIGASAAFFQHTLPENPRRART